MELTDKIRQSLSSHDGLAFYILFYLQKQVMRYGIMQRVKEMTDSQVSISPGTMLRTLSKDGKGWFDFLILEEESVNLSDH